MNQIVLYTRSSFHSLLASPHNNQFHTYTGALIFLYITQPDWSFNGPMWPYKDRGNCWPNSEPVIGCDLSCLLHALMCLNLLLLNARKGNHRQSPELTLQTLSRVHVWQQLMFGCLPPLVKYKSCITNAENRPSLKRAKTCKDSGTNTNAHTHKHCLSDGFMSLPLSL